MLRRVPEMNGRRPGLAARRNHAQPLDRPSGDFEGFAIFWRSFVGEFDACVVKRIRPALELPRAGRDTERSDHGDRYRRSSPLWNPCYHPRASSARIDLATFRRKIEGETPVGFWADRG